MTPDAASASLQATRYRYHPAPLAFQEGADYRRLGANVVVLFKEVCGEFLTRASPPINSTTPPPPPGPVRVRGHTSRRASRRSASPRARQREPSRCGGGKWRSDECAARAERRARARYAQSGEREQRLRRATSASAGVLTCADRSRPTSASSSSRTRPGGTLGKRGERSASVARLGRPRVLLRVCAHGATAEGRRRRRCDKKHNQTRPSTHSCWWLLRLRLEDEQA